MIKEKEIKTILLLDDDEDECCLFKDAFDSLKLEKEFSCLNDSLKLEKALEENPDIIFLDINMPKRNGFDCLDIVRKEMNLELPIVMYSNSYRTADVEKAYKKGANLFIRKPSSLNNLKNIIKEVLKKDWKEIEELTLSHSSENKVLVMG